MIDTATEQLILMKEAAKKLPGGMAVETLWRWRTRGVRGCKLETVLIGGRRMTSQEALKRFFDATTAAGEAGPSKGQTPRQSERAIRQAEKRAAELGV